tara:strand:+ start:362 stop:712 length:351 start_codon:yes stop_codon:yes gene_type:complete
MKKEYGNYNHLCRMPNTEENRAMIKMIRSLMKLSESRWQLVLRGRHPIEGKNYGWGGGLPLKHAKSFSIYVVPRKSVRDAEMSQNQKRWRKEWQNKKALEDISNTIKKWKYNPYND